jgi:hypothetical protein
MSLCIRCRSSVQPPNPVDDPRQDLEDLETEITRVQELLSQLEQKRASLKKKVNACFSPVLQLPVEITSEIFTTCFPVNALDVWGSRTPLDLGKICSAWREVAWSIPWLWNTVSLRVPRCLPVHAELLDQWLLRSGQLLLSVHLDFSFDEQVNSSCGNRPPMSRVMDLVARSSTRLRKVDLRIPQLLCNHLSSTFRAAPSLHDVTLRGFCPKSIALPVNQLTRLRLSPTTFEECLEVLGASPQLAQCTFEEILCSDVRNPTPVLASGLESLEIISTTHIALSELLDNLVIPNVRELAFHVTGNVFPEWSFISLISRSSCILLRLTLSRIRISERSLRTCLSMIPSLVHLNIDNVDCITNSTILVLNPYHPTCGIPILPNLQSLKYSGDLSHLNMEYFADMLEARWGKLPLIDDTEPQNNPPRRRAAQLLSVFIDTKTFDSHYVLPTLRALFNQGMKIVIKCDEIKRTN